MEKALFLFLPVRRQIGIKDAIFQDIFGIARRRIPKIDMRLILGGQAIQFFVGFADIRRAEFHAMPVAAEEVNHAIAVEVADALLQFRAEIARETACIALSQDALIHAKSVSGRSMRRS